MDSVKMLPANIKLLNSYRTTDWREKHNEYLCDELMDMSFLPESKIRLDIDLPSPQGGRGYIHPVIIGSSDGSVQGYIHRETVLQSYARPRGYDFFNIDSNGKLKVEVCKSKYGNDYNNHRWISPFRRLNMSGKSSKYPGPHREKTFTNFIIPLNLEKDRNLILKTLYDPDGKWKMGFSYKDKLTEEQKILDMELGTNGWEGIDWTDFDAEEDRRTLENIAILKK